MLDYESFPFECLLDEPVVSSFIMTELPRADREDGSIVARDKEGADHGFQAAILVYGFFHSQDGVFVLLCGLELEQVCGAFLLVERRGVPNDDSFVAVGGIDLTMKKPGIERNYRSLYEFKVL